MVRVGFPRVWPGNYQDHFSIGYFTYNLVQSIYLFMAVRLSSVQQEIFLNVSKAVRQMKSREKSKIYNLVKQWTWKYPEIGGTVLRIVSGRLRW